MKKNRNQPSPGEPSGGPASDSEDRTRAAPPGEESLLEILETVSDGFFLLDDQLVLTYMNGPAARHLGVSPDKVIGRPLFDAFPEARGSVFEEKYREALRTRNFVRFETAFEIPPYFNWYEVQVHPRSEGLAVVFRVTTEQRRAERELRESEERYRNLFESAGDGILVVEEAWVVDCNPAALRILGCREKPELIGRAAWDFSPPFQPDGRDSMGAARAIVEGALRGEPQHFEWRHLRKDGLPIDVDVSMSQYAAGGRNLLQVIIRDITARKETEQALRESERQKEMILESTAEAVICVDPKLRVIWANRIAREAAGISAEAVVGRPCYEVWHRRESHCGNCVTLAAYREKRPLKKEVETPDGRFWQLRSYPILEDGAVVALVEFGRDITVRKQAEAEKAKLEQKFRQAQKLESIGRLAGGVAHDLNNLLSPILGYSEMLRMDAGAGPAQLNVEWLEQIEQAGLRARDLVRQLLAFSRKQALAFQPVRLNDLLRGFEKLLRRTIREDVDILWALSPGLPPVMGDPGQLEQVLMNLAVNAQDAMPGGGKLTLETAAVELDESYAARHPGAKPGRYVMLAVSDTGTGMDETVRGQLFEPFFSTKQNGEGTGLGLATVYGIVKQHGGNIWVYSEPGHGATFKVYLPAAENVPVVAPKERPAETNVMPEIPETILLVEDEDAVRELATTILKGKGYTVLAASGGAEALSRLERARNPVHLLLTDVVMPGMNGRELFRRAAGIRPEIRVVYMSGYTDNVIAHHGVLDEGVQFLQKPFSVQSLLRAVRKALDAG
jgi:PAS domain S-box-containing protein